LNPINIPVLEYLVKAEIIEDEPDGSQEAQDHHKEEPGLSTLYRWRCTHNHAEHSQYL